MHPIEKAAEDKIAMGLVPPGGMSRARKKTWRRMQANRLRNEAERVVIAEGQLLKPNPNPNSEVP